MCRASEQDTLLPKYMPGLDGLRAFAIIPVLFFHLNIPGFQIGWAGVFLFFVISGFLITNILYQTKKHVCYFRNFYMRRILRIFPIYFFTLFLVLLIAFFKKMPLGDIVWYPIYLQNYLLGFKSFSPLFPSFFSHSWTLAVEEQFYLIWPFIVYYLPYKRLLFVSVALIIFAPVFRYLVAHITGNPFLVFTPLPCVIDSLAIGSLIAILVRKVKYCELMVKFASRIVTILLIIIVLIIYTHGYHNYGNPDNYLIGSYVNTLFLYSLLSLLFAGVIIIVVFKQSSLITRILSLNFIRHIGKISYGLYLYHLPVYWVVGLTLNKLIKLCSFGHVGGGVILTTVFLISKLIVTYICASLSWHFIEKRFVALKEKWTVIA